MTGATVNLYNELHAALTNGTLTAPQFSAAYSGSLPLGIYGGAPPEMCDLEVFCQFLIRKNYGPDSAEAMLSLFNTKAIFRVPETVSAEWASRYMGDLIWNQARESVRYGTSETMDGASIADGRVVERKVMPHEIIDLPDRTAFLSIAGDFPIAKATTQFDRKTDPVRMKRPAFVPRAFADLAWGDADRIPQPKRSTDPARRRKPHQNNRLQRKTHHRTR